MNKEKLIKSAKIFVLSVGIIYITLTVMACISAINDIENASTTNVGFGTVVSLIWFQVCIIVFLGLTYYVYCKKGNKGIIFELIITVALFLNVIVNMMLSKETSSLVFLNFIIPTCMLVHSLLFLYGMYIHGKEAKIKELFNIK